MMFTHPDRKHKPLRPRAAGRSYRGGGPSPWAATAATQDFQVGGNVFFPGSASSYSGQGGNGGAGKSPRASAGGAAGGAGADGDVTLVEPGKVGRDIGLLLGEGYGVEETCQPWIDCRYYHARVLGVGGEVNDDLPRFSARDSG